MVVAVTTQVDAKEGQRFARILSKRLVDRCFAVLGLSGCFTYNLVTVSRYVFFPCFSRYLGHCLSAKQVQIEYIHLEQSAS